MRKQVSCHGFVLLDVLIALLIAGMALVIFLGNVALGTRNTGLARKRLEELIVKKNRYEEERMVQFY